MTRAPCWVRAVVVAAMLMVASPMASSFATGLVDVPEVTSPVDTPDIPKSNPATGSDPLAPGSTGGDAAEDVGDVIDDIAKGANGSGGLPVPTPSESPEEPTEDEEADDGGAVGDAGSGAAGATGSGRKGTSSGGRSGTTAPPRTTGDLSPTGVGKAAAGDGGVLHMARPFAPSVIIAVIGLLLLASAARGNDRLVKRIPEGSRAGSWRL